MSTPYDRRVKVVGCRAYSPGSQHYKGTDKSVETFLDAFVKRQHNLL